MEQITNTRTMIETADAKATAVEAFHDPSRVWSRLNQVTLNPFALAQNGVVLDNQDPHSVPFERLGARLVRHVASTGMRRIGITAPTSGCGTTTLIANIALALAAQPDLRTILFDFDLRNPALIHVLDLERIGPKYSALTAARRSFDSTALRLTDGLALSLNATPETDPTALLSAHATQALLQQIEEDFEPDLMLFDLPPLFPMPEALAALNLMDGTFITARAGLSTVPEIDAAERAVAEHSTCLGVLLNECRFMDPITKAPRRAKHG